MGLDELGTALWRQRELLETLLFKLEEEELIIAHGRPQWVSRAVREVELVLENIQKVELARSIEAETAAAALGLNPDASLREIAEVAPAPWDDMMHNHHAALSELAAQIATRTHSNQELLEQTLRSTQQALLGLEQTAGTYDPKGASGGRDDVSFLIDEEI